MKHYYRTIDVWVQGSILWAFIFSLVISAPIIDIMFYVLAGWFVISTIIHAYIATNRYNIFYYTLAIISIVSMLCWATAFLFAPLFWVVVFVVVYIMPLLALVHFIACIAEIRYLRKRPISLLK